MLSFLQAYFVSQHNTNGIWKCKTVVKVECGNNKKVTGMAGIRSGVFTRRQLWEGGRKVGQESESFTAALCGPLPATALMTPTHAHTPTLSCIIHKANRHTWHMHINKIIKVDLQQLKASVDTKGLALGSRKQE